MLVGHFYCTWHGQKNEPSKNTELIIFKLLHYLVQL